MLLQTLYPKVRDSFFFLFLIRLEAVIKFLSFIIFFFLEHMNTLGTGRWYVETVSCHPRNASSLSTHHQLWIHSFALLIQYTIEREVETGG